MQGNHVHVNFCRVLYEAGTAARAAQQPATALLLLNLYLDVVEAMDEHNPAGLPDRSPFAGCDVPWEAQLPAAHYVPNDVQETVRRHCQSETHGVLFFPSHH